MEDYILQTIKVQPVERDGRRAAGEHGCITRIVDDSRCNSFARVVVDCICIEWSSLRKFGWGGGALTRFPSGTISVAKIGYSKTEVMQGEKIKF